MFHNKNRGRGVSIQSILNGSYQPGNHINGKSLSKSKVPAQWRKTKWSSEHLENLKHDLMTFTPTQNPEVTRTRILLIGPVGAGKSSFFNTIDSVFRNRMTQMASSGSTTQSLTTNYTTYTIKDESGNEKNFCLCDTRGMEEQKGIHVDDIKHLLDGHIKDNYEFSPTQPLSAWNFNYFKSDSKADDRVHCIAFVLDATKVDTLSKRFLENVRLLQSLARKKTIVQTVVLTKIDNLCKDTKKDISFACTSPIVEKAVKGVAELLGLPPFNVFPVKNYENETELDDNISILALTAMKQMVLFADDAIGKKRKEGKEEEHKSWCKIL